MHCFSVVMVSVAIAIQLHGNIARKTSLNTNPEIADYIMYVPPIFIGLL